MRLAFGPGGAEYHAGSMEPLAADLADLELRARELSRGRTGVSAIAW